MKVLSSTSLLRLRMAAVKAFAFLTTVVAVVVVGGKILLGLHWLVWVLLAVIALFLIGDDSEVVWQAFRDLLGKSFEDLCDWVSGELFCSGPAARTPGAAEFVRNLEKRVELVESRIFRLPLSQGLKAAGYNLCSSLSDKLAGLEVGYRSDEAVWALREWGIGDDSPRVTWHHLLELEEVVCAAEKLCESKALTGWIQDDCPELALFRFDGEGFTPKAPCELYEGPEQWTNFELDFVSSGILQRETAVVASLERMERSTSSFRKLLLRANRIGPRPLPRRAFGQRRLPQGS
jgi:hypothetical protein